VPNYALKPPEKVAFRFVGQNQGFFLPRRQNRVLSGWAFSFN
jgi:hypothetical protein